MFVNTTFCIFACSPTHSTYLCHDNIAVGSTLIGYHVVEDELWHLRCLAAPSVALDDDHLVTLDSGHYLSGSIRYGQAKTILQALHGVDGGREKEKSESREISVYKCVCGICVRVCMWGGGCEVKGWDLHFPPLIYGQNYYIIYDDLIMTSQWKGN